MRIENVKNETGFLFFHERRKQFIKDSIYNKETPYQVYSSGFVFILKRIVLSTFFDVSITASLAYNGLPAWFLFHPLYKLYDSSNLVLEVLVFYFKETRGLRAR